MTLSEHVYVLRNCKEGGVAHDGFVWPQEGMVEALDWNPEPVCGGGLHGWLDAMGDMSAGHGEGAPVWIVAKVRRDEVVALDGKVKFPRCEVVFYGAVEGAVAYLASVGVCGYKGTATAGDDGTATAGYAGTATAGNRGTATAGNRGTATAGEKGEIRIRYWDLKTERYRVAVGYVGENGIEAGVPYVVEDGQLRRRKP